MFLPEPQDLCVKPKRFVLVVNYDARELDAHESLRNRTPQVCWNCVASGCAQAANRMGKCPRRQSAHESQASWRQVRGKGARHLHQSSNAAPVRSWWLPDPPREEGAEATQTRKADFHTDIRYGIVPRGEEVLGG